MEESFKPGGLRSPFSDIPTPLYRYIERDALTPAAAEAVKRYDDHFGAIKSLLITKAALRQHQLAAADIENIRETLENFSKGQEKTSELSRSIERGLEKSKTLGTITATHVFYTPGYAGYVDFGKNVKRFSSPAVFTIYLETDMGCLVKFHTLTASPIQVAVTVAHREELEAKADEVRERIVEQRRKVEGAYAAHLLGKKLVIKSTNSATRSGGIATTVPGSELPVWKELKEVRVSKKGPKK